MSLRSQVFDEVERLASSIPAPLYWLDTDGVFLGGNQLCLDVTGAKSLDAFIGKTYDEIHPTDIAKPIIQNIQMVVATGKTVECEEYIRDLQTGNVRYFTAIRSPLRDRDNNIVGIIATSIEITAQKEAESLKLRNQKLELENETQKIAAKLEEHQKFRHVADQMANNGQAI